MAKLQMIDGVPHRMRRGKLVEIPKEWLGKVPSGQTMRERKRTATIKKRNRGHGNIKGDGRH